MLTLPIPLVTALILGFLLARMLVRGRGRPSLLVLIALCGAQGVVIALAQHYEVEVFRFVQPVTASMIPPLAWVSFLVSAVRPLSLRLDLPHMLVPLMVAVVVALGLDALDVIIPGLFLLYAALIWRVCSQGPDVLARLRLEAGDVPMRVWRVVAIALAFSALSDGAIVLSQLLGFGAWQPMIISVSTSAVLFFIGAVCLSENLSAPDEPDAKDDASPPVQRSVDHELYARFEAQMERDQLYLDPDLTLNKLARRLRVSAKALSSAINAQTGENVSRTINAMRIKAAGEALIAGNSVTSAMLTSGFNTKSNFNREFLRIHGVSPRAWLAARNP